MWISALRVTDPEAIKFCQNRIDGNGAGLAHDIAERALLELLACDSRQRKRLWSFARHFGNLATSASVRKSADRDEFLRLIG